MELLNRRVSELHKKMESGLLNERFEALVHNSILQTREAKRRQEIWGAWKAYMLEIKSRKAKVTRMGTLLRTIQLRQAFNAYKRRVPRQNLMPVYNA